MKPTTFVGIALHGGRFEVDTRRAGDQCVTADFPMDDEGVELLKRYVASLREPVRLAIVISVATVGLALAMGELPEREVILVSPQVADHSAALVRFAARAV